MQVNTASRFSAYAAWSVAQGYLTARGGHRLGLCGTAVIREGHMTGIKELRSVCIRVARDFPGLGSRFAGPAGDRLCTDSGSAGSGKNHPPAGSDSPDFRRQAGAGGGGGSAGGSCSLRCIMATNFRPAAAPMC